MTTKSPLILRAVVLVGSVGLALGGSTALAAAQTGSLDSGFGVDIESVLGPVGELLPEPGSLDEAVATASAESEAGSADARGAAQSALPSPSAAGSSGRGIGIPGAGSLGPLPAGLGEGDGRDAGSAVPGVLEQAPAKAGTDGRGSVGPGAGSGAESGAGITAVIVMAGLLAEPGEGAPGAATLPPLPPVR